MTQKIQQRWVSNSQHLRAKKLTPQRHGLMKHIILSKYFTNIKFLGQRQKIRVYVKIILRSTIAWWGNERETNELS
jgi:hypothetical protein